MRFASLSNPTSHRSIQKLGNRSPQRSNASIPKSPSWLLPKLTARKFESSAPDVIRACLLDSRPELINRLFLRFFQTFGTVEPVLEYANITIPQQECVKDLGVYVNRRFKWNTHTQCKVSNSRRAFYKLKNTIPWSTPSHIKYKLYVAYVVPILLYGSQICCLSLADLRAFENIQEKCLRWVYGNSRNYLDTLLTYKILPMAFRIQIEDCRMLAQRKLLSDFCDNVEVLSLGVTRRRRNKFKLKRKVANGSFYERSINMINFFYRHGIIDDDYFKINKIVEHFESIIPFFNPCF